MLVGGPIRSVVCHARGSSIYSRLQDTVRRMINSASFRSVQDNSELGVGGKEFLVGKDLNYELMLKIAMEEAQQGFREGGVPIGAALFDRQGNVLGRGHNRRVQENDPSVHAETDAFRRAGRQRSYRNTIMVTTLAPCWYCSGLIRQFKIGAVVVGESVNFAGGLSWLQENGVEVIDLHSRECEPMLAEFIRKHPDIWNEDIGEE